MTNEEIVQAWKNPELRSQFNNIPEHPAGEPGIQSNLNMGDVQAETHPTVFITSTIFLTVTGQCP